MKNRWAQIAFLFVALVISIPALGGDISGNGDTRGVVLEVDCEFYISDEVVKIRIFEEREEPYTLGIQFLNNANQILLFDLLESSGEAQMGRAVIRIDRGKSLPEQSVVFVLQVILDSVNNGFDGVY